VTYGTTEQEYSNLVHAWDGKLLCSRIPTGTVCGWQVAPAVIYS